MRRALYLLIIFICTSLTTVAQTIENPVFDRTDVPAFHIDKVSINKDATILQCTYAAEANSWANISEDTYLLDTKTNKRYPIQKSEGLPYAPEQKKFLFEERCEVTLYFPSFIPKGKLDLIENKDERAFNVYGIDLNSQFEKQYQESEILRFSNMSSFYESSDDTIKAILFKKENFCAYEYKYGSKSKEYIYAAVSLCDMFDKYGYQQDAINQMTKITKELDGLQTIDMREKGILKRKLAEYYSHATQYNHSIDTYLEALAIFESIKSFDDQYACTLGLLSDDYGANGDEDNSILYRYKSVNVRRELGDCEKYLDDLGAIIIGFDENSNRLERTKIAEKELNNLPEFVDTTSFTYVFDLEAICINYSIMRDYNSAIMYCDKILQWLDKFGGENRYKIAEILGMKSTYNFFLGNWYEAISYGEESKNIYDSLQIQSTRYTDMLAFLAISYAEVYDYDKSICLTNQISSICEVKQDWLSLSESLHYTGYYCQLKEDLINAERFYRKALDIINSHDKSEDYLEKTINGVDIAHKHFSETILNSIHDRIVSAKNKCLSSLARLQQKMGKIEEAIQLEREVLKLDKENNHEQSYAVDLMILSGYYNENNQSKEAILCAEESIELAQKIGNFSYSPAIFTLASVSYKTGDIERAISYIKKAVLVSKRFGDFMAMINGYDYLFSFYYSKKDYNKGESILSEALDSLQKSIERVFYVMKSEQKQRYWGHYQDEFLTYRSLINKVSELEDFNSKLFNYSIFSKSLLLDSESMDVAEFQRRININWKNIQNKLSIKDIAIEFVSNRIDSSNYEYYALIIDKTCQYPHIISLFNENDYMNKKGMNTKTDLEILGDLIWKPILCQYSNVENIYFSPDGILNRLPIEYCYVDGIDEMMDHYNLFRLSSTKEIVFQNKKAQEANAILYGGLNYETQVIESTDNDSIKGNSLLRSINARGGFDPLFSALEEVQEIDSLLKNKNILSTLYTDEKGTEESFKKLSGKDVNMIHLSTHGMYIGPDIVYQKKIKNNFNFLELITNEKDPVQEDIVLTHSFLVMSGGNKLIYRKTIAPQIDDDILTAFEISQLDLRKVDMVVLSV